MRIWSDKIASSSTLYLALKDARLFADVRLDVTASTDTARRRRHRFDVRVTGEADRHTRYVNAGTSYYRPRGSEGDRAATWMDWGWWLAVLFRHDPAMIAGTYNGRDDFLADTAHAWPRRFRTDKSCKDWAAFRPGAYDVGYTPFADLSHLPPNHLVDLTDPEQVEPWLSAS